MHFCKRCVVFVLIVVCAFSIVNSASGVSQFSSSREVKMRVADPRNAFISLPEMLEINIKILEEAINKDDMLLTQPQGSGGESEEVIRIESELIVKNNLGNSIRLKRIDFSDSNIEINPEGYILNSGEEKKIPISYKGTASDIYEKIIEKSINREFSKAVLYFEWDEGSSIIHMDVIINYELMKKTQEESTEEATEQEEVTVREQDAIQ